MNDLIDPSKNILNVETMLRMDRAEIEALRRQNQRQAKVIEALKNEVKILRCVFAATVLQLGGEVTVTKEDLAQSYKADRSQDPATGALSWKIERLETKPDLKIVQ